MKFSTPSLSPLRKDQVWKKKENGCTASKKFFHLVWVKKEGGGWGARKCKRKIVQVSRLFFCFHFGQCFWCSSTLFSPLMDCDYFMATWLIVCITIIGLLFCFLMSWIQLPKNKTENAILPTSKNWYKKNALWDGLSVLYPRRIRYRFDQVFANNLD